MVVVDCLLFAQDDNFNLLHTNIFPRKHVLLTSSLIGGNIKTKPVTTYSINATTIELITIMMPSLLNLT